MNGCCEQGNIFIFQRSLGFPHVKFEIICFFYLFVFWFFGFSFLSFFFFYHFLANPRANFEPIAIKQSHSPYVNHFVAQFQVRGHWESCCKVRFLSLAKHHPLNPNAMLQRFMSLVSVPPHPQKQQTRSFMMLSDSIKRNQWHEMGYSTKPLIPVLLQSIFFRQELAPIYNFLPNSTAVNSVQWKRTKLNGTVCLGWFRRIVKVLSSNVFQ